MSFTQSMQTGQTQDFSGISGDEEASFTASSHDDEDADDDSSYSSSEDESDETFIDQKKKKSPRKIDRVLSSTVSNSGRPASVPLRAVGRGLLDTEEASFTDLSRDNEEDGSSYSSDEEEDQSDDDTYIEHKKKSPRSREKDRVLRSTGFNSRRLSSSSVPFASIEQPVVPLAVGSFPDSVEGIPTASIPQTSAEDGSDEEEWLAMFEQMPTSVDEYWKKQFLSLVQFKKQHGHINVPKRANHPLNDWVRRQKDNYRRGKLSNFKFAALDRIGINGVVPDQSQMTESLWNQQFESLVQFKKQHGHTKVPRSVNRPLHDWVRSQWKKYREGKQSEARKVALERLGINDVPDQSEIMESLWNQQYESLVRFKERHGHINVNYRKNRRLRDWVRKQWKTYREGKQSEARKAALEKIGINGFPDRVQKREGLWNEQFESLVQFKKQYGHIEVPKAVNRSLHDWVRSQRRKCREGKQSEERKVALDSIQFDWNLQEGGVRVVAGRDEEPSQLARPKRVTRSATTIVSQLRKKAKLERRKPSAACRGEISEELAQADPSFAFRETRASRAGRRTTGTQSTVSSDIASVEVGPEPLLHGETVSCEIILDGIDCNRRIRLPRDTTTLAHARQAIHEQLGSERIARDMTWRDLAWHFDLGFVALTPAQEGKVKVQVFPQRTGNDSPRQLYLVRDV